ncbi:MAG: nucleotide exchange factor GrpE [Gordonia sp. (in: high G+C Gram-positive bacteria)]|uniref:nucleotide exchange factor GrpE n=1 Tax=Gordonia sp. (in: high G+C Gram-positive bacteria) TaxID=84139 RepID=UPI0039E619AF
MTEPFEPGQGEPEPDVTEAAAAGADDAPAAAGGPADASADAGAAADDEVAELTAALQRERAQFANFKRRSEEESAQKVSLGKQLVIEQLLPILDDLDRAREHGDLESGPLRALSDKLTATLAAQGLSTYGAPGDPFDPELHEAVQNDGTGASPVLGEVYRVGYRVGDRVVRTAMVTVTDGDAAPAPDAG